MPGNLSNNPRKYNRVSEGMLEQNLCENETMENVGEPLICICIFD